MPLSVAIPVFNEAQRLPMLVDRLGSALRDLDWEVIFVNNDSTDTFDLLQRAAMTDRRVKVLNFPCNFGHQSPITAGLDFAQGDAVAVMDADLQGPPGILPQMLNLLQEGYDVLSPQRISREGDTFLRD